MPLVLHTPAERDALPSRLAVLGLARKRVSLAAGAFALVATAAAVVAASGVLDAAFHLPPLGRAFALVALLAAVGVLWVRGVARPLAYRTDPLAVALELEDRFPTLNDALASAVSFLALGDKPRPVISHRLQTSAVRAAERKAGRLPLDRLVPTARCWRAAWVCVAVLAVTIPLALWNTARAATVVVRLADPFGAHPWPAKTRIDVVAPEQFPVRMPKGDAFELKFEVRGVLAGPATVRVQAASGGEFEEQYPLALNNDPTRPGAAVVTARFDAARVPTTFSVRVTANDADTGWQAVTVVPPPRLVPLDGRPSPQFHVTPPAYTGLKPDDRPAGAGVIEAPVGSVIRFRAATDVRISAAVLVYAGDRSAVIDPAPMAHLGQFNPIVATATAQAADDAGGDIPLTISADGTRLSATFTPTFSGQYILRLTDDTGLTGTQRVEIRLTTDPSPKVMLLRPLAGRDPAMLTPSAALTVRMTAGDKLYGVRRSFLQYRVGRDGPVREIPLAEVANVPVGPLVAAGGGPAVAAVPPQGPVDVSRRIPVSRFLRDDGKPVRAGDRIVLSAASDDWDDVAVLKGPGVSRAWGTDDANDTPPPLTGGTELPPLVRVEIRVASPDTIEAWLQKELAALRPDLVSVREIQRDAARKLAGITPKLGGGLSVNDHGRLIGAEPIQRQARGKVIDARDGLRAKAQLLLATVQTNVLPGSNTTDRVDKVADGLGRMADRMGTLEQTLAEARRLAGQAGKPGTEGQLADALRKVRRQQKDVEDIATTLLDVLSQWGGAGEIRSDARALRADLLELLASNEQLKTRVRVGKLHPEEDGQRELDRLAVKVEAAAERASQLIARAARFATEKDAQTAGLRAQAAAKQKEADDLRARAAAAPSPVEQAELVAKANAAAAAAVELQAAADRTATEARALRVGIAAAVGQGLADDLRFGAAPAVRDNRLYDTTGSAQRLRDAIARLDAMIAALTEKEPDASTALTQPKRLKGIADQLDALAGAQDDLRKRTAAAQRIADLAARVAALKALAGEQDRLIERGRELYQKLAREKFGDAARDVRAALDKMEIARDDLERGQPAAVTQAEAVTLLDMARDRLDLAVLQVGRQQADNKRHRLADRVKALLAQQKKAVAEAGRIHGEVVTRKGWDAPLRTAYSDLDEVSEKDIVAEVRALAAGEFAPHPVLARLLTDAADAIDIARARINKRCDEIDLGAEFDAKAEAEFASAVMRPMMLAVRRLELLAEALKPDEPKTPGNKGSTTPLPAQPPKPPGGARDLVPPLAQLKALRALQADLNERTTAFAAEHPNADKLTPAEQAELKELERAQREISELFTELAKQFQKKDMPPPPNPEKP